MVVNKSKERSDDDEIDDEEDQPKVSSKRPSVTKKAQKKVEEEEDDEEEEPKEKKPKITASPKVTIKNCSSHAPDPTDHEIGNIDAELDGEGAKMCKNSDDHFYDTHLHFGEGNSSKYYVIQVIEIGGKNKFYCFSRWGRTRAKGQHSTQGPFSDVDDAISIFEKKFQEKTGNEWKSLLNEEFVQKKGKYKCLLSPMTNSSTKKIQNKSAKQENVSDHEKPKAAAPIKSKTSATIKKEDDDEESDHEKPKVAPIKSKGVAKKIKEVEEEDEVSDHEKPKVVAPSKAKVAAAAAMKKKQQPEEEESDHEKPKVVAPSKAKVAAAAAMKKKQQPEEEESDHEKPKVAPAKGKASLKKKVEEDDDEEVSDHEKPKVAPTKAKIAPSKNKKEVEEDDDVSDHEKPKVAPKARAAATKKKTEEDDDEVSDHEKPKVAPKARAAATKKKSKEEDDDEVSDHEKPKVAPKARAAATKKKTKEEDDDEVSDHEKPKVTPKARAAATKKKTEEDEVSDHEKPKVAAKAKAAATKKKTKEEDDDEVSDHEKPKVAPKARAAATKKKTEEDEVSDHEKPKVAAKAKAVVAAKKKPVAEDDSVSDHEKPKSSKKKVKVEEEEDDHEKPKSSKKKAKVEEEEDDHEKPKMNKKTEKKKDTTGGGGGKIPIDEHFKGTGTVYQDFDCTLNQTNIGTNNNKFYRIQIIQESNGKYTCYTRWGRVGENGKSMVDSSLDVDKAMKAFKSKFREKTKNDWDDRENFVKHAGKYDLLKMDYEAKMNHGGKGEEDDQDNDGEEEGETEESKLDAVTQHFVKLIFDKEMFTESMKELKVDVTRLPLGGLSKQQIKEGNIVLEKIMLELDGSKRKSVLEELSSKYYTVIPTAVGRARPPVLTNAEMVQEKFDLLAVLGDIEQAQEMEKDAKKNAKLHTDNDKRPNPIDEVYATLDAELELIEDIDSEEFKIISKYSENTGGKKLLNCWRIIHRFEDEDERDDFYDDVSNRKLLWHGTNSAVVAAIIKSGLRIMPHSGGRVGRGIYLASENSKASSYVWPANDGKKKKVGMLFLAEAVLGKEHSIYKDDPSLRKAPKGFDSIIARGEQDPNEKEDTTLEFDGRKVVVPQGKPIKKDVTSAFFQSEYLVYNENQHRLRYVLTYDW